MTFKLEFTDEYLNNVKQRIENVGKTYAIGEELAEFGSMMYTLHDMVFKDLDEFTNWWDDWDNDNVDPPYFKEFSFDDLFDEVEKYISDEVQIPLEARAMMTCAIAERMIELMNLEE